LDASETCTVVVERDFPFPLERIWRALTEPHLLEEWLMENDFKPVVGHRFNLRRTPRPDLDIVIDCEVLAVDPQKTLSYSWAALGLESVVTMTLSRTPTGTRLRMEQSGFRQGQEQAFRGATAGWQQFFGALEQLVGRID
jgi:uncharacterized protein YndB with AHSA1/START domain